MEISNNSNNKEDALAIKAMIPVGKCGGLLFGAVQQKQDAQPGEVKITHRYQNSNKGRNNP